MLGQTIWGYIGVKNFGDAEVLPHEIVRDWSSRNALFPYVCYHAKFGRSW